MKRSDILALGISEKDQIDGILELHKADVELWKSQKEELAAQHKVAVDDLNAKLGAAPNGDLGLKAQLEALQTKYDDEAAAHVKTKADHEAKETLATKRALARESLVAAGVKPDIADDFMLSALDYNSVTVKDGRITDVDKFIAAQKERYGKYFGEVKTEGAQVANPPANNGGEPNPWKKGDGYSLQKQTELFRKDPDKARQMAAAVGVKL